VLRKMYVMVLVSVRLLGFATYMKSTAIITVISLALAFIH